MTLPSQFDDFNGREISITSPVIFDTKSGQESVLGKPRLADSPLLKRRAPCGESSESIPFALVATTAPIDEPDVPRP